MHKLIAPKMLVPMHGEHRHLRAHKALGEANNIPGALAPNGTILDLGGETPQLAGHIEAGRVYLDGTRLVGSFDGVVRDRIRMALNGHVTVTVILEDEDVVGDPWCETMGLAETGQSNAPLVDVLEEDLSQFLNRAAAKTLADDDALDEALRRIVRKTASEELGKRPEVTIVVSRLS